MELEGDYEDLMISEIVINMIGKPVSCRGLLAYLQESRASFCKDRPKPVEERLEDWATRAEVVREARQGREPSRGLALLCFWLLCSLLLYLCTYLEEIKTCFHVAEKMTNIVPSVRFCSRVLTHLCTQTNAIPHQSPTKASSQ